MLGDRRLAAGDDIVDIEAEGGGAFGRRARPAGGAATGDQHAHADAQHIGLAQVIGGDDPGPVDAVSARDRDAGLTGADEVIAPAGNNEALAGADGEGRGEVVGPGDRFRARTGDVGYVAQRVAILHDIGRVADRPRVGRDGTRLPGRRRRRNGADIFVDAARFVALGRVVLRRIIARLIGFGARILRNAAACQQHDDQRGAGPQELASHGPPSLSDTQRRA